MAIIKITQALSASKKVKRNCSHDAEGRVGNFGNAKAPSTAGGHVPRGPEATCTLRLLDLDEVEEGYLDFEDR